MIDDLHQMLGLGCRGGPSGLPLDVTSIWLFSPCDLNGPQPFPDSFYFLENFLSPSLSLSLSLSLSTYLSIYLYISPFLIFSFFIYLSICLSLYRCFSITFLFSLCLSFFPLSISLSFLLLSFLAFPRLYLQQISVLLYGARSWSRCDQSYLCPGLLVLLSSVSGCPGRVPLASGERNERLVWPANQRAVLVIWRGVGLGSVYRVCLHPAAWLWVHFLVVLCFTRFPLSLCSCILCFSSLHEYGFFQLWYVFSLTLHAHQSLCVPWPLFQCIFLPFYRRIIFLFYKPLSHHFCGVS